MATVGSGDQVCVGTRMTSITRPPLSVKVVFGLAFIVSILAVAVGTALYEWHFRQERSETGNMLSAIADLKVRQVSEWLAERIGDANAVAINPNNVKAVSKCLEPRSDCGALTGALTAIMSSYGYYGAAVVTVDGSILASAGQPYTLHSQDRIILSQIAAGGGSRLSDLHVNEQGVLEFEVVAPLTEGGRVVAAVFLVIDAERGFLPTLASWPVPLGNGESMLLRIDAPDVQVITLPHPGGRVMTWRISQMDDRIEAMAALGREGLFSAQDYNGTDTVGAARMVPETPWMLLVKQNVEGLRSTVRWSAVATAAITAMFVVMTGAVALVWIAGQLDHIRLVEKTRLRVVEAQTEWLRRFGNDIVLLVDEKGRVIDANDRAESAYGYTRDELMQLTIHELRSSDADMRRSPLTLDAGKGEGQVFRTHHRRKDGSIIPVEVSIRVLVVDGQRMYQDIIRDISDRVAAEATISRQARMYAALSQTNKALMRVQDKQDLLDELCTAAVRLGGFRGAWVAMRQQTGSYLKITCVNGAMKKWQEAIRLSLDPLDPFGGSVTATAVLEGRMQCVRDVQDAPALGPWRPVIVEEGLQAIAAFPLRESGEICGSFTVFSRDRDAFDDETLSLLGEMVEDLTFGLDYLQRENWRRTAEESLRQSEIRYRALVEDHPGMLCRFLADGTLTFVNDAYCRVFGKTAAQLLGTSFFDLIPEADQDSARQQVARLGPDNLTISNVHRAIGANGQIRWQEWTDRVLIDADRQIVEYQAAGKDITERVEMEQALRDNQEFLTAMAAATRDAIIVMDDCGRVTFWNNSAELILGYGQDEAFGRPVHSLISSAEDEQSFLAGLTRFKETGTGPIVGRTLELQARNKAGEHFPVELAVNTFRLKGEWHAVGIMRDIRDRKEMELSLWQFQKMESLGNLAGGIAHDINNMLQPILGFAILLQDDVPEEAKPSVQVILDAANRIKAMVQQILTFSRKEEIVRGRMDIARAVQQAVNFLRPTIPTSIQIEEDIDPETGIVIADRTQIHAMILNLVSNAVDAMAGRVGRLSVSLMAQVASDAVEPSNGTPYAVIEVRDTGKGMDEKTVSRMFDPFFTTKPTGQGTGLGLSIVHGMVTQNGGFVHVHSVPEQGTAIQVWLPLVTNPPKEGENDL